MKIIALFFPAIIALKLGTRTERKEKYVWLDLLTRYSVYTIVINLSIMAIISYVLGIDGLTASVLESFSFFIVYTIMASLYAVFIVVIEKILSKNRKNTGE